jgi:cephalosporin hydroxylase
VEQVRQLISPGETVLVILDSNHSRDHVLAELTAYGPLVTPGSYIVATDGIMQDLAGRPGAKPEWTWDNPQEAARLFVKSNPGWQLADPPLLFNEGAITERVTYWPGAYLRRL